MAHNLLFTMGYNAPEDRLLPGRLRLGATAQQLDEAYRQVARALRPWTIDFHVAQNDGTVKGSALTTRPDVTACPNDPERQARRRPRRGLLAA